MRNVPDTTGLDGYGETYGEIGDSPTASSRKVFFQELIQKANTVPMLRLFKHYGLRVASTQCTIVCPFKSHKGGRENTGSFTYYPSTNSFYCFGCKVGGPQSHASEFMANMDGTTRVKAAYKILDLFRNDVSDDVGATYETQNFSEQLEIMMDFSTTVRNFRHNHFDEKSTAFIERICRVYDDLNLKHKLDNEALRRIVEELKKEINQYKPCLTL
jgi:hypothetical protein